MVNVFGDRDASSNTQPGPRGPRGAKGNPRKSGIDDICRWIPDLTLEQFQKNETCCFQLTYPAKDLTKSAGGAYVSWISRSGSKMNAIQNPSKKVLHISKTHNALVFIKSLHEVKDVVLSPVKSYVSLCVKYLILGDEDQTIVTNYDEDNPNLPFREISASNKEIWIWGAKNKSSYVPIEQQKKLLFLWNGRIMDKVHFALMVKILLEHLHVKTHWR